MNSTSIPSNSPAVEHDDRVAPVTESGIEDQQIRPAALVQDDLAPLLLPFVEGLANAQMRIPGLDVLEEGSVLGVSLDGPEVRHDLSLHLLGDRFHEDRTQGIDLARP